MKLARRPVAGCEHLERPPDQRGSFFVDLDSAYLPPPLHRQQFVLHELAHMILGHCDGDDCAVEEVLLPNIPPYTRARLLSRQDLDSETEIAAESLADRLAAGIRGAVFAESAYSEVFG